MRLARPNHALELHALDAPLPGSGSGFAAEHSPSAGAPPPALPEALLKVGAAADAADAVWDERIQGVRGAYVDSCSRLVGALEELEQTLCTLSGDETAPTSRSCTRART